MGTVQRLPLSVREDHWISLEWQVKGTSATYDRVHEVLGCRA